MAENATQSTPSSYRLIDMDLVLWRLEWVSRPLGLLILTLWVLHPAVAAPAGDSHAHSALLGFLFGAFYGIILFLRTLRQHIHLRMGATRHQHNRVPEEYYWGRIDKVMFDNK